MKRTTFHIQAMDCSCEEQMVRMRLEELSGVVALEFDLGERTLDVFHETSQQTLQEELDGLRLGARLIDHAEQAEAPHTDDRAVNRNPLMWALMINAALFVGELTAGVLSGSMGLVADSLDMLADALVYALSLAAVGGSASHKRRLATGSGYLQATLALFGLVEVVRRFLSPQGAPEVWAMVAVSLVALAANAATLLVLRQTKRGEAHIEASWIFTSNDIKVNILVIIAGLLVWWSSSQVPDLVVGGLIFAIVINGARRILALTQPEQAH